MDLAAFAGLSPTTFADVLPRDGVMDHGIRPLRARAHRERIEATLREHRIGPA